MRVKIKSTGMFTGKVGDVVKIIPLIPKVYVVKFEGINHPQRFKADKVEVLDE